MSGNTILLVDDEPTVRAYIRTILRSDGFEVLEASDGVEGLETVQRRGGAINLLLTDVRMPRMDGLTLAHSATDLYPNLPVLFISGYPLDLESEKRRHPKKACGFVEKPFRPQFLREAVRKCLEDRAHASQTIA